MAKAEKTGQEAPRPRRKRRSSDEIVDRVLTAAAEEFGQSGFAGATTAAIARRADVTEAQIFRLFASKQALFRAAIFTPLNRHFAEFHSANRAPPDDENAMREVARRYICELQDFIAEHSRMFMTLIVASSYSPETNDWIGEMDGLRSYFDQGASSMRSNAERPRVEPELMVRVSFAAVLASLMFKDWLFPRGMASDGDIREAIVDFVIDGIRANYPSR